MKVCRNILTGLALTTLGLLAACGDTTPQPAASEPTEPAKSIFRPEFQIEPIGGERPPPALDARIFFPEGNELTEAARADLATIINAPQVAAGGPIELRGHSDAGGSDADNLRISQQRAEAVKAFLVENGIAEERIATIAFGEQNPIAPNALPDGTPDERGRARNRRVDVHVATLAPVSGEKKPTLAETLSETADGAEGSAPSD